MPNAPVGTRVPADLPVAPERNSAVGEHLSDARRYRIKMDKLPEGVHLV
ncbi:hypothetical protein [Streptomyces sp. ODS05-4]|nr:hypothetical protein [Streptomyces sp. ODS05-4]